MMQQRNKNKVNTIIFLQRVYASLLVLKCLNYNLKKTCLLSAGTDTGFTYAYDNNGNLIQKTNKTTAETTTYAYDAENRLIQMSKLGTIATYKYDPFGRRIEKNINGAIKKYLYDNEDIIIEYNTNNRITCRYIHGAGIDEPLSLEKEGQNYYYHSDALGSIKKMTDSGGNIVRTYNYKSYGSTADQSGTLNQPYMFTAREYDSESGLYYDRERYYDPKIGRFISKDPIGFAGGDVNLSRYVENDPVNWIDPEGLKKKTGKGKGKKKKRHGEKPDEDSGDDIGGDWVFGFRYVCKKWDCNVNTPCHWKGGSQISKPGYGNVDCICVEWGYEVTKIPID